MPFHLGRLVLHNQVTYSITFSIASRYEQIALVRAAMSGVLQHLMVMKEDIFDLQLAVSEILNNTLEHGYRCATDQKVEVTLNMYGQTMEVEVVDACPAFPEAERYRIDEEIQPLSEPSEDWPIRGHGLQIARQVIDSLQLSSREKENRFTLTKKVRLMAE